MENGLPTVVDKTTRRIMEGDMPPAVVINDSCLLEDRPKSLDLLNPETFSNSQRRHSSVDLKTFFGVKEKNTLEGNDFSIEDSRDTLDFPPTPRERRRSFSGFIEELCSPTNESKTTDTRPAENDQSFLHRPYEFEAGSDTRLREHSRSVGELTNIGDNIGGKFKRLFSKPGSELDVRTPDQRQNDGATLKHAESCTLPVGIRPKYDTFADDDQRRWSLQPTALTWGRRRVSRLLDFNLKSLFKQEGATRGVLIEAECQDEVHKEQTNETAIEDEFVEFYNQVVRTLLHPLGKFDCSEISPLELISHLRKILDVDQALHSSLIKDQVNKLPHKVILKLRVIDAKDLKPMDSNGLSDPYFIISLGTKTTSRSSTLERKSNLSSSTPQLERKENSSIDYETPSGDQLKNEGSVDGSSATNSEKGKNKKVKTIDRIRSFGKGDARTKPIIEPIIEPINESDDKTDGNSEVTPSGDGSELKKDGSIDNGSGSESRKNKKQKKVARLKSTGKGDSKATSVEANGDNCNSETTPSKDQIKKKKVPTATLR